MPGCLGFLPSTVGFDFGLCEIGFQVAFRQTSLDELLPVDDCAENYKGRQRQGELETAFLIALISGWSGENKTNKNKGSWMKSNCKILARYLTPQKVIEKLSHRWCNCQMVQPLYSFLRCFALLPKGKNGTTIDIPEAMNLQNERQNHGPWKR